jgi:hypothetical protein
MVGCWGMSDKIGLAAPTAPTRSLGRCGELTAPVDTRGHALVEHEALDGDGAYAADGVGTRRLC